MELNKKVISANFLMLISTGFIAASFPVTQALLQYWAADIALFTRFALSTLVFLALLKMKGNKDKIIPKNWRAYLFISLFYALFFMSTFEALKYTTAFNAGVIYTLMPGLSLLLSWFLFKDSNIKRYLLPLALSTAASFVVISNGSMNIGDFFAHMNMGDILFIAGTFAMACFFNITKKYTSKEQPLLSTFYVLLGVTFWLGIYVAVSGQEFKAQLDILPLALLLFLVVFCTVITFFSLQYASRIISPVKSSSYSYLTPVFVILINLAFFSMQINAIVIIASLISMASLIYIQWVKPKAISPPLPVCNLQANES